MNCLVRGCQDRQGAGTREGTGIYAMVEYFSGFLKSYCLTQRIDWSLTWVISHGVHGVLRKVFTAIYIVDSALIVSCTWDMTRLPLRGKQERDFKNVTRGTRACLRPFLCRDRISSETGGCP